MSIRGVIFDLDGTLVDSCLDFDLIRREIGIRGTLPLLEALAEMSAADAERSWPILAEHERRGAERAVVFPGVHAFLANLSARGLARGILTRNSRTATLATLERLGLAFDPVVCREDAPAKPNPTAILTICETWGIRPSQCVIVGDYRFDIEAGRRAGTYAVLFSGGRRPSGLANHDTVDLLLPSFADSAAFWTWLDEIDLGREPSPC